jgi:Ser/Thr protein kinase RdoA (MazF antagonist)
VWDDVLARLDEEGLRASIASLWGAEAESLRLVSARANAIFRFESGGGARCLRLTHGAIRDEAEVRAAADFLAHLARSGAPVCAPVPSERGTLVEQITQGRNAFFASVVELVPGRPLGDGVALSEPPPPREAWRALGRALGAMHAATESYTPPEGTRFWQWDEQWRQARERLERAADRAGLEEWRRLDTALARLPRGAAEFGLTHGDCNTSNAIFDGERVRWVDFDEPTFCWFATDVARPLRETSTLTREARRALVDALVSGYRDARPLDEGWVEALPELAAAKSLEIYAWALDPGLWTGDLLPGGGRRDETLAEIRRSFGRPLAI